MGSRRRLGFTVCDIVITVRKLETYIDEGHVHKLGSILSFIICVETCGFQRKGLEMCKTVYSEVQKNEWSTMLGLLARC